jgi:hypothetical protein
MAKSKTPAKRVKTADAKRNAARGRSAEDKPRPKGKTAKPSAAQLAIINAWISLLPPELRTRGFAELGMKAMMHPQFRAELVSNPAAAMKKMSVRLGKGARVSFHDNKSSSRFQIVLPPAGAAGRKLVIRDKDLKSETVSHAGAFVDDFFRDPTVWSNRRNDGPRGAPGADTWDMLNKVNDTRDPHAGDVTGDFV